MMLFPYLADGPEVWKNPAQTSTRTIREYFRDLLWQEYPGASEREVARRAAPHLGRSERQIINYLRCTHDVPLSTAAQVLIRAGLLNRLPPRR